MMSVIVPAYNAEKFIKKAIESVIYQTYKDIEVLVVNDGSTDNTENICIELSKKDSRIFYYKKENAGVSDTRNFAMLHAKGEYITFLDADDYLPPYAIEIMVKELTSEKCDVIFGNHAYDYSGKILPRNARIKAGYYTYEQLKNRLVDDGTLTGMLFGSVCGVGYKRDIIDNINIKFDTKLKVNEDGLFNLMYLKNTSKIRVVETPYIYVYRQWKINRNLLLHINEDFYIANRTIRKYLKSINELKVYKKQFYCREVSMIFWNILQIKDAKTNLIEARKYLNKLCSNRKVIKGLNYMDYQNMNQYKRFICLLMRGQQYTLLYLLIRHVYPMLQSFVKR